MTLIAADCLGIAVGCLGARTRLTLSPTQAEIRDRYFSFYQGVTTVPLTQIRRAATETTDFNHRLTLITDARTIEVFGYNSRDSSAILKPHAIKAILTHLRLPDKPLDLASARIPEQFNFN